MSVQTVRVVAFAIMERGHRKAYDELTELFPEARILRMDVDTTRKKGSHQALLEQFGNGEADIFARNPDDCQGLGFSKCDLGWCSQCGYGFEPS